MATGTSPNVSSPVFHGDDPEQTTDYRTLSVLAIISLVIGVAAPLAIVAPLLIAIPLFGIAVALLALRRIAVSGGTLAGRWAAILGLVLCIASAVGPFSHDLIQRTMRTSQATEFGRSWIAMVTSGDSKQAFRLTVDGSRPQPAPEAGAAPKPTPYQAFADKPVIKALQAAGANAEIRLSDTLDYQASTFQNISVRQRYVVTASANAVSQPTELVLTIQRAKLPRESMSRWLVSRIDDAKAAADATPTH